MCRYSLTLCKPQACTAKLSLSFRLLKVSVAWEVPYECLRTINIFSLGVLKSFSQLRQVWGFKTEHYVVDFPLNMRSSFFLFVIIILMGNNNSLKRGNLNTFQ